MSLLQTVWGIDFSYGLPKDTPVADEAPTAVEAFGMGEFYRQVGQRIRNLRQKKTDLTQESLAQSVGLTRTSLTNIEKGRQKILLHTFSRIAAALGVSPIELLPQGSGILEKMGVDVPASITQTVRGFIERTISPGGTNENGKAKGNSSPSDQAPRSKRNQERTS